MFFFVKMRHKRDTKHPWLAQHPDRDDEVSDLQDWELVCIFLAANASRGDNAAVARDWRFVPTGRQATAIELVLQNFLFVGFPRTINALATIRSQLEQTDRDGSRLSSSVEGGDSETTDYRAAGEALCSRVYDRAYGLLRKRMQSIHEDLDAWMVEVGYGRVLSRKGASPRLRELAVIAVLCGQNVPAQLESHLRGAIHVGADVHECHAVVQSAALIWGDDVQAQVWQVWQRFLDRASHRL